MHVTHSPATPPEFEYVDHREGALRYLEHGYPSALVRWHCHDAFELHHIVESSGKLFVGDFVGRFTAGQMVLTGPRLPHNWISEDVPANGLVLRDQVVQFEAGLVPAMATSAPELKPLMPLLDRARYGIEFLGTSRQECRRHMDLIRDSEGPGRIGHFLSFMQLLAVDDDYRLLSTVSMCSDADEAMLERMDRITEFMTTHYRQKLSLSMVAAHVGMSDSVFSRFFSRVTGKGFSDFLNRIRISKACELLTTSDMPITAICFDTGFNSVANFNRRFRHIKSLTPREYREQSRLRHHPVTTPDATVR